MAAAISTVYLVAEYFVSYLGDRLYVCFVTGNGSVSQNSQDWPRKSNIGKTQAARLDCAYLIL